MYAAYAAVVRDAEPLQVRGGLYPRPDLISVGDSRIGHFQPGQVNTVLQGELDMGVMEFQRADDVAFQEVSNADAERAPGGCFGAAVICGVVAVVRVISARRVSRVVHQVAMADRLVVCVNHHATPCQHGGDVVPAFGRVVVVARA